MRFARTSPQESFQTIVDERGRQLRETAFEELEALTAMPTEHLIVESRRATIDIIVQAQPSGGVRVVVQGFMDSRWFPPMKLVALNGFYKYPDETIAPMPQEEFYEFD